MDRFEAHKLHSILWLHRLPWPLQPPWLLVLSYSLMLHSLISFFFGLILELCSLVLISQYFPHLSLPLSAISFVSLSLAAFLLSSPSPTISHISLYPFLFHPQHFGSQSRGPGLPAVDYHTSDCSPSLHGPISCIRLNISQKLAQFRWICVCLDKWYVVKCVWVISLCSGITVMCVTKESLLLWMQCNPVIFKGWAWGLEGAHVRTSAALSVPVSSLKKKKKKTVRQLDQSPL